MANFQSLEIIGYAGSNPEVKTTNNGSKVANFSIGVTEKGYTKQNGDKVEDHTEWFKIVAYGKTADVVERFVKKGMLLMVVGRLRTEKYQDKNGMDRYTTKTICEKLIILSKIESENSVPISEKSNETSVGSSYDGLPF